MEAPESFKVGRPLHFHMPLSLQRFPKFAELPYDIRHKIWELAIYVPGIHFLRLEPNEEFRPAQWLRNKRLPKELQSDDLPYSSFLRPAFTSAAGDTSHYIQRNQALANLAHSCNEARYLVDRATSHPDNMRLPHAYGRDYDTGTGPLVTLARADDIICIDYPEMKSTEEHKHLGLWTVNIDNRQFSKIRNVAARYHITWGEDQRTCTNYGRVHEATRQKPKIPRHLNQFLTLFPKMEMFYLIDCFAVKRKEWRVNPGCHARFKTFECGTRSYFEAHAATATLGRNVTTTIDWIHETFRDACEKGLIDRISASQLKGRSSGKPQDHSQSHTSIRAVNGPVAPKSRIYRMMLLACAWDKDAVDGAKTLRPPRQKKKSRLSKTARDLVRDRARMQYLWTNGRSRATATATPTESTGLAGVMTQLSLSSDLKTNGIFDFSFQERDPSTLVFGLRPHE